MAYATTDKLIYTHGGVSGSPSFFYHESADNAAAVNAAGFITDGGSKGLKVGDYIHHRDTTSASGVTTAHRVLSVSSTGAGAVSLGEGNQVTVVTDSVTGGITGVTAGSVDVISGIKANNSGVGAMRARNNYGISKGTVRVDFLSGWVVGTNGAGTATINAGTGLEGNNSCTLACNGGTYTLVKKTGLAWNFQSTDILTLIMDSMTGFANNDNVRVEFSSDGFSTKSGYMASTIKLAHGDKIYMSFALADATLNGGESLANTMNYFAVRLTAGNTATCRILGVLLNAQARPKLLIDFDDGFRELYTNVFPRLARYGIVGNVAVIKRTVGKNAGDIDTHDYCSLDQLQQIEASGWDMITHGYWPHNDASFPTRASLLADVIENRDYVEANFVKGAKTSRHYVYPGGIVSTPNDSYGVMVEAGMVTARLVDSNPTCTFPYGVDYKLAMWTRDISQTTGISAITTMVDRAIATGQTVRIHGHRVMVTVANANNEVSTTDWASCTDMLRDRIKDGLIDNQTVSQWYQHLT